jgi:membrane-bound lytic murein transglycosylase B
MQRAWVITGFSTGAIVVLAAGLALSASIPHPRASAPPLPMADLVDEVPIEALDGPVDGLANREWLVQTSAATGVPERALQAYAGAVVAIEWGLPECNLGWSTLAAIGYVESRHGTYEGSTIDAEGVVTPTILGPALDGNGHGEISDTDGGVLDGDTTWDRAVGPMQFIPSTWTSSGHDGDLDTVISPNDIDDAAYTAGLYLCATAGGDMREPVNWRQAIASYNQSMEYAIAVAKAANRYAAAVAEPAD